jgi:hypothetical protein
MNRRRPARKRDGVFRTGFCGKLPLKGIDMRTKRRNPIGIERVEKILALPG